MEISTSNYQKTSNKHALGSSLKTLQDSGDQVFKKIHKLKIPHSSNAIGTSSETIKRLGHQLLLKLSKTSNILILSKRALISLTANISSIIPKKGITNHAMGESLEILKSSTRNLLDQISKRS